MNWVGKIIGAVLGFFLGGPVGLLLGLFVGHWVVDQGLLLRWASNRTTFSGARHKIQAVFFNATFRIMGYVAKSDGRVSENEIRAARHIMEQMGLDASLRREAIRLFTEGKSSHFNLSGALSQLKQACLFQPSLLRIFLEIQAQMLYADGKTVSEHKQRVLLDICKQLGVSGFNFKSSDQRAYGEQNYQQYQQKPERPSEQPLQSAYATLGVTQTATDTEVKKVYRRLMNRHHPDKLIAKGLPPEMIKMATQKTQQIKSAYEQILKARSIHR